MAKDVMDHLVDFWEGIKSMPKGLYNFGGYLARVTGFRDWQEQSGSVIYDGTVIYLEQDKALGETKLLKHAWRNDTSRDLIFDALQNDASNRPAYYISSLLTGFAIGGVLKNIEGSVSISALKAGGLILDTTHDVLEELKTQLGLSDQQFQDLLNNDKLKEEIEKNINFYIENNPEYLNNKNNDIYQKLELAKDKSLEELIQEDLGYTSEQFNELKATMNNTDFDTSMREDFKSLGWTDEQYDELSDAIKNDKHHPLVDSVRTEEQLARSAPLEDTQTKNLKQENEDDNVYRQS